MVCMNPSLHTSTNRLGYNSVARVLTQHIPNLSLMSALNKLYVVAHTCDLSTQVEVGGLGVQGYFQLHMEVKVRLGYLRLSQNIKKA